VFSWQHNLSKSQETETVTETLHMLRRIIWKFLFYLCMKHVKISGLQSTATFSDGNGSIHVQTMLSVFKRLLKTVNVWTSNLKVITANTCIISKWHHYQLLHTPSPNMCWRMLWNQASVIVEKSKQAELSSLTCW